MTIRPISRKFLIDVANASEFATHDAVIALVSTLTKAGPFAEATDDEIEAHDNLFNALEDQG